MQIWNKVLYLGINSECEIILGLRWDNLDGNLNSAFSSSIAALAGGELPSVAFLMRGRFLSSIAALAGGELPSVGFLMRGKFSSSIASLAGALGSLRSHV